MPIYRNNNFITILQYSNAISGVININAILCIDELGNIGRDGDIIFDIKEDKKKFKEYTRNKIIIMGRKTYESFPKKLKDRTHVVITRDTSYVPRDKGVYVINSIDDIDSLYKIFPFCKKSDFIVIGGASIYNKLIPMCDEVFVTRVIDTVVKDADTRIDMSVLDTFNNKIVSRPSVVKDRKSEKMVKIVYETYIK